MAFPYTFPYDFDMAATPFAPEFTITVSSDGLTLTIEDQSNYTDNDESLVISSFTTREVVLLDAYGEDIATVSLGSQLEVTATITADIWVNATLVLTGDSLNYTKNHLFGFDRITKNLFGELQIGGCCTNPTVENALMKATILFRGADEAELSGNGPAWQTDIDAAYAFLNSVS